MSFLFHIKYNFKGKNGRIKEIDKLTDQVNLVWIAKKEKDSDIRKLAIAKIVDIDCLEWIVKNDNNSNNREISTSKITDQTILSWIAINDSDERIRLKATNMLCNQDIIAVIAKKDSDIDVRKAAIDKLNNQTILEEIAKNDNNADVRLTAINKLDQLVLEDIAINASDAIARKVAIEKITNQKILSDIIKNNDVNVDVRWTAIKKLFDQSELEDIAKNSVDLSIRKTAIGKLTNQTIIADIAKNDSITNIRLTAIEKLTEQGILENFAKSDSNANVRKAAINKITNQKLLSDIANKNDVADVRKFAMQILRKQSNVSQNSQDDDSGTNERVSTTQKDTKKNAKSQYTSAQLIQDVTKHFTLLAPEPGQMNIQAERVSALIEFGPNIIREIEAAIQRVVTNGKNSYEFENAGLLCEVLGKIGGNKASEVLKYYANYESNIYEYKYIRSCAENWLTYLDKKNQSATHIVNINKPHQVNSFTRKDIPSLIKKAEVYVQDGDSFDSIMTYLQAVEIDPLHMMSSILAWIRISSVITGLKVPSQNWIKLPINLIPDSVISILARLPNETNVPGYPGEYAEPPTESEIRNTIHDLREIIISYSQQPQVYENSTISDMETKEAEVKMLSNFLSNAYLAHEAAEALAKIANASAIESLTKVVKNSKSWEWENSAMALYTIDDTNAREILISSAMNNLSNPDNRVRRTAIEIINKLGISIEKNSQIMPKCVEKQFEEWTHNSIKQMEEICFTLPILDFQKAKSFFDEASLSLEIQIHAKERTQGAIFDSLSGVVIACDRKDFTVKYDLDQQNISYGILTLEIYDSAIGVLFCVARISENNYLTYAFTQHHKPKIKALIERKLI